MVLNMIILFLRAYGGNFRVNSIQKTGELEGVCVLLEWVINNSSPLNPSLSVCVFFFFSLLFRLTKVVEGFIWMYSFLNKKRNPNFVVCVNRKLTSLGHAQKRGTF